MLNLTNWKCVCPKLLHCSRKPLVKWPYSSSHVGDCIPCTPQKNRTNYAATFTYHISICHLLFWYMSPINTWNRKSLLKLFISIKILLHSLHCTAQTVNDRIYFIATHPSNEKPKLNTLIPCLRSNKLSLPQQNLKTP